MKKITSLFLLITSCVLAQPTPQYFNTTAPNGNNSYPFNTTIGRKIQWCIEANSLGSVGSGNNIVKVYFQAATSQTGNYPLLEVRLKTGTSAGLTGSGGLYETGMTTVYSGTNVSLTSVTGQWFSITLNTPFLYNPTLPLLIEVENNNSAGVGPSVYQNAFTGSGYGRLYGNNGNATYTGGDYIRVNFGIDVIPATPCTVTPVANSVAGPTAPICPNASALLTIANTYSFGGITYQWQSSTSSNVGPFTAITNATSSAYSAPNLTTTTWFNVVATCTNVTGSTTLTAAGVSIAATTTNTAPFYESFEGIGQAGKLPNCSWVISNSNLCLTYTSSNTSGRVPRTGTSFASFYYNPGGVNYFYTNGIYLNAGVTYSASLWYETEYYGYGNWSDLSILRGTSQTTTGLVSIASTNGPAISNIYRSLSNTFTVPNSGLYYIVVRGTGNTSSSAQYLSWDDLEISIPCTPDSSPNTPTVSLNPSATTICESEMVTITAGGANSYTWSTGANGISISDNPVSDILYSVIGMNNLTGCLDTALINITVNSKPQIFTIANKPTVCSGSQSTITAFGANSFTWNTGGTNPIVIVAPTANTTYTVLGINNYGCVGSATYMVHVNQLPTINIGTLNDICLKEPAELNANGAVSYTWLASSSSFIYSGNPITVSPSVTTIYTVTGVDVNGCKQSSTIVLNVNDCVGISKISMNSNGIRFYPNPTTADLFIESNNNSQKTIQLIDLSGRIILTQSDSQEITKFSLSNCAKGIYYLRVTAEDGVSTFKVVKE
jgi:hypothetical protein